MFPASLRLPVIAAFIAVWCQLTPAYAGITPEQCDEDLQQLLGDIEANRNTTLKVIARQISETEILSERQALEAMREQVWDQEERQRGRAHYIWRDCMTASKAWK